MTESTSMADAVANLTVLDENGVAIALKSAWAEKTTVVAFLRHFG